MVFLLGFHQATPNLFILVSQLENGRISFFCLTTLLVHHGVDKDLQHVSRRTRMLVVHGMAIKFHNVTMCLNVHICFYSNIFR